ncbi:MAG TPA: 4Fe-4S binding protein [Candidatus Deferrimicrobium sp.]|nr:4Fe-4S binding protein [Candidatus Deferrimicrobium sp.]
MEPYKRMVQTLMKFPIGGIETNAFLEFLKQLFSPEEAALCSSLSVFPLEPVRRIAKKWDKSKEETEEVLERLAQKGVIMKRDGKYGLLNVIFLIDGIFGDDKLLEGKNGKLLSELILKSFEEGLADEFFDSKTPAGRIVPINLAVQDQREIMPSEQIFEILYHAEWIRLVDCACRKRKLLIGQKCKFPLQTCMVIGGKTSDIGGGEYHANLESGRSVSKDEAKELVKSFERLGLVHYCDNNASNINLICNCCACCCDILAGLLKFNKPRAFAKANFISQILPDKCIGCGQCLERCPFHAITLDPDNVAQVDDSRCIGCGVCFSACENGAISLQRFERESIPDSAVELGLKLMQEKGRSMF